MNANQGNRKAVLLVSILFVLGIALGSMGTYLVTTQVQAARPHASLSHNYAGTVAMYTRGLSLSPDQEKQLEAIFNDVRGNYESLHKKLDPEYEQVRQQGRERIRQILTPEQRPKFEDLLRQIDEDRRRRAAEGHD
jgi:Spy/CpxP family protein refolding chaperone